VTTGGCALAAYSSAHRLYAFRHDIAGRLSLVLNSTNKCLAGCPSMSNILDFLRQKLSPELEQLVSDVVQDWCTDRGVPMGSDEANVIEQEVLQWVHFGIHKKEELKEIVRPI